MGLGEYHEEPASFPPQQQPVAFPPPGSQPAAFPPPGSPAAAFPPPGSQAAPFPPPGSQAAPFPPPGSQAAPFPPPGSQAAPFPPPGSQAAPFPPGSQPVPFPPPGSQAAAFPPPGSQPAAFPPPGSQPAAFPPGSQPVPFPPPGLQENPVPFPPPGPQPNPHPGSYIHPSQVQFQQPSLVSFPPQQSPLVQNTQQPGIPVYPIPAAKTPWSTSLFDCFDDPSNALITFCFPCVTFGQVAEILDNGQTTCVTAGIIYGVIAAFTGIPCIYSCGFRSKLRARYNLEETPGPDWLVHFVCECCALCQAYRELTKQGWDLTIGWHENMRKNAVLVQMTPPNPQVMIYN